MLIIDEATSRELLDMGEAIPVLEESFRALSMGPTLGFRGDVEDPERSTRGILIGSYVGPLDAVCFKVVGYLAGPPGRAHRGLRHRHGKAGGAGRRGTRHGHSDRRGLGRRHSNPGQAGEPSPGDPGHGPAGSDSTPGDARSAANRAGLGVEPDGGERRGVDRTGARRRSERRPLPWS